MKELTLDDIKELFNEENKEQTKADLIQCFEYIINELD